MARHEILLMRSLIERTQQQLESAYVVHRYDTAPDRDALIRDIAPRVTAIATRGDYPLPGSLMERLPNVKLVASSGTGYDGIDVASARRLGIAVTNSPSAAAECVADAAWSLLLGTLRRTTMSPADDITRRNLRLIFHKCWPAALSPNMATRRSFSPGLISPRACGCC